MTEAATTADPYAPFKSLKYVDGHAREGQEVVIPQKKSYILSYNTKTLRVEDFVEFPDDVSLTAFKSVIINSLDNFLAAYEVHVKELAGWHQMAHDKKCPGTPTFDRNAAAGVLMRAQGRFENFLQEFSKWQGSKRTILLPFAELVYTESKKKDEPSYCDIMKSQHTVNGMLFEFQYRYE